MSPGEGATEPHRKLTLRERLSALFAEYGNIAVITYFSLSILTIIGFAIAFTIGTAPETAGGVLGVLGAAWLAGKATLLLRIPITLALTPGVAFVVNRLRRRRQVVPSGGDDTDPR